MLNPDLAAKLAYAYLKSLDKDLATKVKHVLAGKKASPEELKEIQEKLKSYLPEVEKKDPKFAAVLKKTFSLTQQKDIDKVIEETNNFYLMIKSAAQHADKPDFDPQQFASKINKLLKSKYLPKEKKQELLKIKENVKKILLDKQKIEEFLKTKGLTDVEIKRIMYAIHSTEDYAKIQKSLGEKFSNLAKQYKKQLNRLQSDMKKILKDEEAILQSLTELSKQQRKRIIYALVAAVVFLIATLLVSKFVSGSYNPIKALKSSNVETYKKFILAILLAGFVISLGVAAYYFYKYTKTKASIETLSRVVSKLTKNLGPRKRRVNG